MNMINVLNRQTFIIVGGSLYVVFAKVINCRTCMAEHIVVLRHCPDAFVHADLVRNGLLRQDKPVLYVSKQKRACT